MLWPAAGLVALILVLRIQPRASGAQAIVPLAMVFYGTLLFGVLRACRSAGVRVSELFGDLPQGAATWLRAICFVPLVMLASLSLVWLTLYASSEIAPAFTSALLARPQPSVVKLLTPANRVPLLLMICIIAPIIEELAFRGLMVRRLLASRGYWASIVLSALVFALLHPHFLLGAWTFGVVGGVLYLGSGSPHVPILVHAVHNSTLALMLLYGGSDARGAPTPLTLSELREALPGMVVVLIVVGACLVLLARPLVQQGRHRAMLMA